MGEGTVVAFDLRVGGVRRHVRARIQEPEPGRVLREIDLDSGAVTTFEVTPAGDASRVRILTAWQPAPQERKKKPMATIR